jgi:hypothetical protein
MVWLEIWPLAPDVATREPDDLEKESFSVPFATFISLPVKIIGNSWKIYFVLSCSVHGGEIVAQLACDRVESIDYKKRSDEQHQHWLSDISLIRYYPIFART